MGLLFNITFCGIKAMINALYLFIIVTGYLFIYLFMYLLIGGVQICLITAYKAVLGIDRNLFFSSFYYQGKSWLHRSGRVSP